MLAAARPLVFALLLLGPMGANASGEDVDREKTVLFDLSELAEPRDFGPDLGSSAGAGLEEPTTHSGTATLSHRAALAGASLTLDGFLASHFEAGMAARLRPLCRLQGQGSCLIVQASPALIQHVTDVIHQARINACIEIATSFRLCLMSLGHRKATYRFPGMTWSAAPGAGQSPSVELNQQEFRALELTLAKDKEVVVSQGEFQAFSGQLGFISVLDQVGYARVGSITTDKDLITDMVDLGDTTTVRGTVTADRAFIHLVLDHRRSALLDMRTIPLAEGSTTDTRCANLPLVWRTSEHIDQTIENDHGLVIACDLYPDRTEDGTPRYRTGFLLVHSQVVPLLEHETGFEKPTRSPPSCVRMPPTPTQDGVTHP